MGYRTLYLAGYTMQEIADAVGVHKDSVSETCRKFAELEKSDKNLANFQDSEFETPIYNVWTFAKKTNNISHPGNSEVRIVENLLYLYTVPFDIVLDPFGGGGSTIDICKKRLRRYWVSDRKPIIERENEIRKLVGRKMHLWCMVLLWSFFIGYFEGGVFFTLQESYVFFQSYNSILEYFIILFLYFQELRNITALTFLGEGFHRAYIIFLFFIFLKRERIFKRSSPS